MKFTAQDTNRVALDGLHVTSFIEGQEYDVSDEHHAQLQEHGVAPMDKPKEAHPVQANKMAHPAVQNKAHQHPHQHKR